MPNAQAYEREGPQVPCRSPAVRALLAITVAIGLVGAGCGSASGPDRQALQSDALRQAISAPLERVVDTTTTTTTTPTTVTTTTVTTTTAVSSLPLPLPAPTLTAEDVVLVYTRHGPPARWDVAGVGQGDFVVLQTACDLLTAADSHEELEQVYETFTVWFVDQLRAVGATADYIDSWDPVGMLDTLVDLGCAPAPVFSGEDRP